MGRKQKLEASKGHRRNNHGDRGRQVPPPTFGLRTINVLVPLNFLVNLNFHYVHIVCVNVIYFESFNGTQALIAGKQPLAIYVHCLMHADNLAAQSALESVAPVRGAIATANDVAVFSRQSTKLSNVLKAVQKQHDVCAAPELDMGPFLLTQSNLIHQLMDPIQFNP